MEKGNWGAKGGCLRAQLNMKYLRARPKLDGVWGRGRRAFVQVAKNFGANKGVTKESEEKGDRRGRQIAGGTETRLRRG